MAAPAISTLNMGSNKIIALLDGTANTDAINLGQLNTAIDGLRAKRTVKVATTANISLSGTQTIDGVSVIANDRVLVKNQTTQSQNGIYVCAGGSWTRASDADTNAEFDSGQSILVQQGTTQGDSIWVLTTNPNITLGTTSLTYQRIGRAGQATAGTYGSATQVPVAVLNDDGTVSSFTNTNIALGATGITGLSSGQVLFGNGSGNIGQSADLGWTGTKFTVNSSNADAHVATPMASFGGAYLVIGDETGGSKTFSNGLGIKFFDSGANHFSQKFDSSAAEMQFGPSSAVSHLQFDTNGLTMRIGNGKVGVGAPAAALSGSAAVFQVTGTIMVTGDGATPATLMGRNASNILGAVGLSTGLSMSAGNLTLGAELQGLSALSANGIIARTGAGTYASRTLSVSVDSSSFAGVTTADLGGVAGNPTITINTSNSTVKLNVRAATTANITLSGAQTIDTVSVVAGDRVLVKNQTTQSQNGIYVAASGAWTRAADLDTTGEAIRGAIVQVQEGGQASTYWKLKEGGTGFTLGTSAQTWDQLFQAGTGVPAGTTYNLQYYDTGGVFGADPNITVVPGSQPKMAIGHTSPTSNLHIKSWNTSNNMFRLTTSANNNVFDVAATGFHHLGNLESYPRFYQTSNGTINAVDFAGGQFMIEGLLDTTTSQFDAIGLGWYGGTLTGTGEYDGVVVKGNDFNPTSGSAILNAMTIRQVINQVGSTGITRSLLIKPTLTAAADHRGLEIEVGATHYALRTISGKIRFDLGSDATGDTYYRDSSGNMVRLAAGATAGHVLTSNGSGAAPSWQAAAGGVSGGTANRLAIWNGTTSLTTDAAYWDFTNDRLGLGSGASTPLTTLHVAGRGGFGDSITASNAIRALNLNSTDAVMRILRISADSTTAAPAIELIHRTTSDGSNTVAFDMYADSNGFKIRDRTSVDTIRMTVNLSGEMAFGSSAPISGFRAYFDGYTRTDGSGTFRGTGNSFSGSNSTPHIRLQNTTASTGDTWYIGSRDDGSMAIQAGNLTDVARFEVTTGRFVQYYSFALASAFSPTSIGANQNNYDPGDGGTAVGLRLTSSGAFDITGMIGTGGGRILKVFNIGSNNITLKNENASSTAANRFALGGDLVLAAGDGCTLWYDTTSSRWRCSGRWTSSGGSGGGAPTTAQYLVLSADGTLTQERVLTAGNNVKVTDGGAGGAATVDVGTETFSLTGDISPTSISTQQDNYSPTGLSTSSTIRINATANLSITGLAGGADGRIIILHNIGTGYITFPHDSASSTAANRFYFSDGSSMVVPPNKGLILQYDSTSSRWRCIGSASVAQDLVVLEYTTSQTNTTVNIPVGCKMIETMAVGGGGGGGGGYRGAAGSNRCGGGGGGSAGATWKMHSMSVLGNPTTLTVTVGAGGTAGTAATTDNTAGGNGGNGGESNVRVAGNNICLAGGSNGGNGGTSATSATGGSGGGYTAGSTANRAGEVDGLSGANGTNAAGGDPSRTQTLGAGSGGGGGGLNTSNASGVGGRQCIGCGGNATFPSQAATGANGAAGTLPFTDAWTGSGGGGGGAGTTGAGGSGGAGIRGGGGGGGGASLNGNNSGAGGAGGTGYVRLVFYF